MQLLLQNGTSLSGRGFGDTLKNVSGELVFCTGMVGYPETLTDPSYKEQIVVFSYPLIGNYGIPIGNMTEWLEENFESSKIHAKAVVVSSLSREYQHRRAFESLDTWLKREGIPGIEGIDTRRLTKMIRNQGTLSAYIGEQPPLDQSWRIDHIASNNLVKEVSIKEPVFYEKGKKVALLVDLGCKNNIIRSLLNRNVSVLRVPWDSDYSNEKYDGVLLSNGPGNPEVLTNTIEVCNNEFLKNKPVFGICLGHQIMAIAAGAKTYKLKFGHRSQNQPCIRVGTKRCYITSQNHSFAVDTSTLPSDWLPWFFNANDGSNEGIIHSEKPIRSVQFHPESWPGPVDTSFLFDEFVNSL